MSCLLSLLVRFGACFLIGLVCAMYVVTLLVGMCYAFDRFSVLLGLLFAVSDKIVGLRYWLRDYCCCIGSFRAGHKCLPPTFAGQVVV